MNRIYIYWTTWFPFEQLIVPIVFGGCGEDWNEYKIISKFDWHACNEVYASSPPIQQFMNTIKLYLWCLLLEWSQDWSDNTSHLKCEPMPVEIVWGVHLWSTTIKICTTVRVRIIRTEVNSHRSLDITYDPVITKVYEKK